MKIILFLVIIFIISFISDIMLRIVAPKYIPSLIPYFNNHSIIVAGTYAGLTIIMATIIMMIINKIIYNKYLPTTLNDIIIFLIIAFIIGWIIDIIIMKTNIFGDSLKPFYEAVGAGFWGASAFVFALIGTFMIINMIV